MVNRILKVVFGIIFVIVFFLGLFLAVRFFYPSEIDDVSPDIFCSSEALMKSDVLWVIPKFNGYSVSENRDWCNYILSLNKTIGMHGVYHTYLEFGGNISQEYLEEGIVIFEDCFGFSPELFKPPQLRISDENAELVESNGMKVKAWKNQFTRKVYHCNDEQSVFRNEFIDLI